MSAPDYPTSPIRTAFVAAFGEDEAARIEAAAEEHANYVNSSNRGSDPFRWALVICIGYQCMSREEFRTYHGIMTPWNVLHDWIVVNGDLRAHDGDCDYLGLFLDAYTPYVGTAEDNT